MSDDNVSLRAYIDSRFESQDKAVTAALAAAEKAVAAALSAADRAVAKAEMASDKRFESMNEFRGTLSDQAHTFLSRPEYDAAHRSLVEKVETMQKLIWVGMGLLLAFQFFIGVALLVWKKQ